MREGRECILKQIVHYTPADIEYLFQKVRQLGFERELAEGDDYRITTETFLEVIPQVPPSLTNEIIEEFRQDHDRYARF